MKRLRSQFVTWFFIPNNSSSTLAFSFMVENSSFSSLVVSSCISVISFSRSVLVCLRFFSFSRRGETEPFGEFFLISWLLEATFFPFGEVGFLFPFTSDSSSRDLFGEGRFSGAEILSATNTLPPVALTAPGTSLLFPSIPYACRRSKSSMTSSQAKRALSIITKRRQFSRIEFKSSQLAHKSASPKPIKQLRMNHHKSIIGTLWFLSISSIKREI